MMETYNSWRLYLIDQDGDVQALTTETAEKLSCEAFSRGDFAMLDVIGNLTGEK